MSYPFSLRRLFIGITILLSLIASWYCTNIWTVIDREAFFFFNHIPVGSTFLQKPIAWINSRYGDWIFELVVISIYFLSIISRKNKLQKKQKVFELVFLIFFIFFVQIVFNTLCCRKILSLNRPSPSYVYELFINFSNFKYPHNRIFTSHSYPSDTATTLFICMMFSWTHFSKRTASFVTLLALIFALPRLIVGAHWLSDIVLGSFVLSYLLWLLTVSAPFYYTMQKKCIGSLLKSDKKTLL